MPTSPVHISMARVRSILLEPTPEPTLQASPRLEWPGLLPVYCPVDGHACATEGIAHLGWNAPNTMTEYDAAGEPLGKGCTLSVDMSMQRGGTVYMGYTGASPVQAQLAGKCARSRMRSGAAQRGGQQLQQQQQRQQASAAMGSPSGATMQAQPQFGPTAGGFRPVERPTTGTYGALGQYGATGQYGMPTGGQGATPYLPTPGRVPMPTMPIPGRQPYNAWPAGRRQ